MNKRIKLADKDVFRIIMEDYSIRRDYSTTSRYMDKHHDFSADFLEKEYIRAAKKDCIWTIIFLERKLITITQYTLIKSLEVVSSEEIKARIEFLLEYKEQKDELF